MTATDVAEGAASRDRPWVCLMYHDVSPVHTGVTGGSGYFSVTAQGFDRQLGLVQDLGLRGCSLDRALAFPREHCVAITFDDGDLGQVTRAFPALVRRGMSATFFVTTGWVGRPGYATWDHLREMHAAGMSIQSHTHTHPFLSELPVDALRDELRRPRELLDEHLGQQTRMIALPGGDAPRRGARHVLETEGYTVVATSRWGLNATTDARVPRYVRRCTIRGEPSDETFTAIVLGSPSLALRKRVREGTLSFIRSSLGPTRYARWRRAVFNAVATRASAEPVEP